MGNFKMWTKTCMLNFRLQQKKQYGELLSAVCYTQVVRGMCLKEWGKTDAIVNQSQAFSRGMIQIQCLQWLELSYGIHNSYLWLQCLFTIQDFLQNNRSFAKTLGKAKDLHAQKCTHENSKYLYLKKCPIMILLSQS